MLETLKTRGVGPADEMDMTFGSRVNLITGDNGLGKTFILELIWWCLTQSWADNPIMGKRETNPFIEWQLNGQEASTKATLPDIGTAYSWQHNLKQGSQDAIIIYAKADGGFVHYDPVEHLWTNSITIPQLIEPQPENHKFNQYDLWNGLTISGKTICRGLLLDWVLWAKIDIDEQDVLKDLHKLKQVLNADWFIQGVRSSVEQDLAKQYNVSQEEIHSKLIAEGIEPDIESQNIFQEIYNEAYINDKMDKIKNESSFNKFSSLLQCLIGQTEKLLPLRKFETLYGSEQAIPALKTVYGVLPITLASSAIKRILSLSYIMLWAYQRNFQLSLDSHRLPTEKIILLLDEVESHLHPQWQRQILPSLLDAIKILNPHINVQIIANTHSPFVCASLEQTFDEETDEIFIFNLDEKGKVSVDPWPFEKHGTVNRWLESEVFGLKKAASLEAEQAIQEAEALPENAPVDEVKAMYQKLLTTLDENDPFLVLWCHTFDKQLNA
jgi:hypothetical protein